MRVLCHFFRPGPSNEEESGLVQIPSWDIGQKNNFGTKFFNFLLFGQSLRDYNLSLPARSRSSGAKNEGVMPFFSSGAFQ